MMGDWEGRRKEESSRRKKRKGKAGRGGGGGRGGNPPIHSLSSVLLTSETELGCSCFAKKTLYNM